MVEANDSKEKPLKKVEEKTLLGEASDCVHRASQRLLSAFFEGPAPEHNLGRLVAAKEKESQQLSATGLSQVGKEITNTLIDGVKLSTANNECAEIKSALIKNSSSDPSASVIGRSKESTNQIKEILAKDSPAAKSGLLDILNSGDIKNVGACDVKSADPNFLRHMENAAREDKAASESKPKTLLEQINSGEVKNVGACDVKSADPAFLQRESRPVKDDRVAPEPQAKTLLEQLNTVDTKNIGACDVKSADLSFLRKNDQAKAQPEKQPDAVQTNASNLYDALNSGNLKVTGACDVKSAEKDLPKIDIYAKNNYAPTPDASLSKNDNGSKQPSVLEQIKSNDYKVGPCSIDEARQADPNKAFNPGKIFDFKPETTAAKQPGDAAKYEPSKNDAGRMTAVEGRPGYEQAAGAASKGPDANNIGSAKDFAANGLGKGANSEISNSTGKTGELRQSDFNRTSDVLRGGSETSGKEIASRTSGQDFARAQENTRVQDTARVQDMRTPDLLRVQDTSRASQTVERDNTIDRVRPNAATQVEAPRMVEAVNTRIQQAPELAKVADPAVKVNTFEQTERSRAFDVVSSAVAAQIAAANAIDRNGSAVQMNRVEQLAPSAAMRVSGGIQDSDSGIQSLKTLSQAQSNLDRMLGIPQGTVSLRVDGSSLSVSTGEFNTARMQNSDKSSAQNAIALQDRGINDSTTRAFRVDDAALQTGIGRKESISLVPGERGLMANESLNGSRTVDSLSGARSAAEAAIAGSRQIGEAHLGIKAGIEKTEGSAVDATGKPLLGIKLPSADPNGTLVVKVGAAETETSIAGKIHSLAEGETELDEHGMPIRKIKAGADKRYLTGVEIGLVAILAMSGAAKMRGEQNFDPTAASAGDADSGQADAVALQKLHRRTHLVRPGETLQSIADELYQNQAVAWLIADMNGPNIKENWIDGKRVIELKSRQQLELPDAEEVTQFMTRLRRDFDVNQLITVISETSVDRELLNNFLGTVTGDTQTQTSAAKPVSAAATTGETPLPIRHTLPELTIDLGFDEDHSMNAGIASLVRDLSSKVGRMVKRPSGKLGAVSP